MARNHLLRTVCVWTLGTCVWAVSTTPILASEYGAGFVWNQGADWSDGPMVNSADGNPGGDQFGNTTWSYEVVLGDGLGGASPWYAQPGTPMVWDQVLEPYPGWHGTVPPNHPAGWAVTVFTGPDSNYPSSGNHIAYTETYWTEIPLLRWINPTGLDALKVNILGDLFLRWGVADSAFDADVAIGLVSGEERSVQLLYWDTISRPDGGDRLLVPVSLLNVGVGPDDQIVITHRTQGFGDREWVEMSTADLDVVIEVLPEPGALTLLLVGAVVAMRRR